MKKILYKLFLGKPEYNFRLPNPAIRNQCLIIKRIWNNEDHNDIGLEKILRLFFATIQFAFPFIYIRHFIWRHGYIYQTIASELYVIMRTILPFIFLYAGLYENKIILCITAYLLIENLCYIVTIIFVADQLVKPRSYSRSIILWLFDYLHIVMGFAVLYAGLHLLGTKANNLLDYVYFSFVTSATIGYGELVPTVAIGKVFVCFQSFIFIVFIVLFLNFFSSRMGHELKDYYQIQKEKNREI